MRIYNFGISGFSLRDNLKFYGDKFCSCKYNFLNMEEHTQDNQILSENVVTFLLTKGLTLKKQIQSRERDKYLDQKKGFVTVRKDYKNIIEKVVFSMDEILQFEKALDSTILVLSEIHLNRNVKIIIHPDRNFRKKNYEKFPVSMDQKLSRNDIKIKNFRDIQQLEKDSLYFDNHHLNNLGQQIFTEYFISYFETIID